MRKGLCPDWCFCQYSDLTAAFLLENGIRYLILDIDNTLAPYEQATPDEGVLNWFASLREAGISYAFVSNNGPARVKRFNEQIGAPAVHYAMKPFRGGVRRAMKLMGATSAETLMMGDQVYTDVWAGRAAGARTALVPPIRDKRDLLTRFKRLLERPVLRRYQRKREQEGNA